jgi:hypothetical protein
MKMKISQIKKVSQPKNTVKQMDRAVVKFKPTAQHQENLAKDRLKKDNPRAVRLDRDIVVREIFQAFEKHQYYRLVLEFNASFNFSSFKARGLATFDKSAGYLHQGNSNRPCHLQHCAAAQKHVGVEA